MTKAQTRGVTKGKKARYIFLSIKNNLEDRQGIFKHMKEERNLVNKVPIKLTEPIGEFNKNTFLSVMR